jgi:FtsH-binding integral membrane protein
VPQERDVSHSDIYHKLGSLEGKVETLILQIAERRDEITGLFGRLRTVEMRLAWAVGVIAFLAFLGPLLVDIQQIPRMPSVHSAPVRPN